MAATAKGPVVHSGLVGQYDPRLLFRVAQTVVHLWVGLHRYAHTMQIALEVKDRVNEVLGGGVFEWCWTWKSVHKQPVSEDDETVQAIFEHICQVEQCKGVASKCCLSISMISERMQALRKLALRPGLPKPKADKLWNGYEAMRRALWQLFETGALAEMPNTPRMTKLNALSLEKLSGILLERWHVLNRIAELDYSGARTNKLLGEALGLSLFNPIRSQQQKRAEIGVDGLVAWFKQGQQRRRRGFYADFGLSLHELARIGAELRQEASQAPKDSQARKSRWHAVDSIEITVFQILGTGILFSVPAQTR